MNRRLQNSLPIQGNIPLLAYFPGKFIVRIIVSPSDTIADLRKSTRIPQAALHFVANGQRLQECKTFCFYKIHAGDIIVGIPNTSDSSEISKWISHTREPDTFAERIFSTLDPRTSKEAARLRDFQMARMEKKPKCFRKLAMTLTTQDNYEPPTTQIPLVIPTTQSDTISTDPLPVLWPTQSSDLPEVLPLTNDSDDESMNKEPINPAIRP